MSKKPIRVYPGSFDPITVGHIDIIKRASTQFPDSKIHIVIANNRDKKHMFSINERIQQVSDSIKEKGIENIKVVAFEGIISNYLNDVNAITIIRGIRNYTDFEYEKSLETFTRKTSNVETIYLSANPEHSSISSSNVRNFVTTGFDEAIKGFVSPSVYDRIINKKHLLREAK
jgi:pantetheine-phosphate adenylyltransferase